VASGAPLGGIQAFVERVTKEQRATATTAEAMTHQARPREAAQGSEAAIPGPTREKVTVNRIRRVRRALAR
jgi:hypothetical protein